MFDLDKILEQWYKTTNRSVDSNSLRMGVESDWLCMKARDYMKDDPTGLLTILTLRSAYKNYIREHQLTIEDLLLGGWDSHKENFEQLRALLFEGEFEEVYSGLINQVIKNISVLGKEYSVEHVSSLDNIEKVLTEAAVDFNKKFKHERFACGGVKHNSGRVLPKLFHFTHFKEFVTALKTAPEDNFMCLAIIDRTSETCRTDYDKRYDTFFCFGVKNNGNIYTISDRVTWKSPEHYYKTRNPARDYEDKLNYSYFPYNSIDDIKLALPTSAMLLLESDNSKQQQESVFMSNFCDEECIYIGVLFTLVYNKYFLEAEEVEVPLKYFSSDVKFIPAKTATESKELVLKDNYVILPALDAKAEDYEGTYNMHNNGMYDYLLDLYPLPEDNQALMVANEYICTLEDMRDYSWWSMRKAQAEYIKKKLDEDCGQRERQIEEWLFERFKQNTTSIFEHMINTKPYDGLKGYNTADYNTQIEGKPILWRDFKDGKCLNTASLTCITDGSVFRPSKWQWRYNHCSAGGMNVCYDTSCRTLFDAWIEEDNNNRTCEIILLLRSHSDFEKFLNVSNEELPKEIRRHFCARLDWCTALGWKPYNGNSILDMVDPMNEINDPYKKIRMKITLHVSKTMLNKFVKQQAERKVYDDKFNIKTQSKHTDNRCTQHKP